MGGRVRMFFPEDAPPDDSYKTHDKWVPVGAVVCAILFVAISALWAFSSPPPTNWHDVQVEVPGYNCERVDKPHEVSYTCTPTTTEALR